MLASIFNKTRPINYVLIGAFISITFFFYVINNEKISITWVNVFSQLTYLMLILASGVLVNFIALKNELTKNNTFAPFLFFVFILFFPSILNNTNILISNFLLLLALRRLISMKSMQHTKEKIFDASFWIFLSALFHFWSIFYIGLVFISIILHVSRDFTNWLIPFIALLAVTILFFICNSFFDNTLLEMILNKTYISFDFSYFENIYQNIALAVFTPIALLFFVNLILTLNNKMISRQSSFKKILFSFVLGVGIFILSANKNNSYLAFCLAPLAILGANLIEGLKTNWIKETTVYLLLFLGLFFFIMQL